MKDSIAKPLSILLYALMGISVLLIVVFVAGWIDHGILLVWTYFLVGIASIASIVFPIIYVVQNPKGAKDMLISVGGIAVIFGISYGLASGELTDVFIREGVDEGISRLVGMGIIGSYLLLAGAVGAIIFSSISKMIK
ncbi:MAG: hypothetical protein COB85_03025 [Bacteroidetes bacterium]|nr:MAG: hypothetical protein COB85_03025 [Bacteroidota bacterium]